jgi:plastocyanin
VRTKGRLERALCLAVALATLAASGPTPAGTVSGTLPAAGVVWISDGSTPAPSANAVITQKDRQFLPHVAIVTVGTIVRFRNDDNIEHSVYSISDPGRFDLGIYEPGPGKDVTFAKSGVIAIRCHIHRPMHATLIVVDGPYTRVEADHETWTLTGVRPGRHVLHLWTPVTGEGTTDVEVR